MSLGFNDNKLSIESQLRILASGEGCDGEPYDQMMLAANEIDRLRTELAAAKKLNKELEPRLKEMLNEASRNAEERIKAARIAGMEEAAEIVDGRVEREEYGHAKCAVVLDAQAIRDRIEEADR